MSNTKEANLDKEQDVFMMENEYLSDEDLENLISLVEEKDVVEAPEYILNDIIERIGKEQEQVHDTLHKEAKSLPPSKPERPPKVLDIQKRRKQYYAYCAKVVVTVAASIAILVGLSLYGDMIFVNADKEISYEEKEAQIKADIPDRDSYMAANYVSKEEATMTYYDKIKNKAQTKIEKFSDKKSAEELIEGDNL